MHCFGCIIFAPSLSSQSIMDALATYSLVLNAVAVLLAVSGLLILAGKGDWLISGYNTASPEEKQKYHIVRLRRIAGVFSLVTALLILLLGRVLRTGCMAESTAALLFSGAAVALTMALVILSNTWARRK